MLRVDIGAFFAEVLANPAAFGFTNTTTPACGATPSLLCSPANLVAPNANQTYVFADGVHPTGAAHAAIASMVASMIEAPFHTATLTEGPLAVEQATFRSVDARMWSGLNTPIAQKGYNLWASYDFANPDLDFGRVVNGDADLHTLSVGGDMRIGDHLVGGRGRSLQRVQGALHGRQPQARGDERDDLRRLRHGAVVPGHLAPHRQPSTTRMCERNFDIGILQRTERGDTNGWHWAFRVLGGYWLNAGNVLHGPFAKLVYQEAEVDSFSEGAGTSTALRYGEQTREVADRQPRLAGAGPVGRRAPVRPRDLGVRVQGR